MVAVQEISLKRRVIRGGAWSIAGHFISQGIRLGGNLITTRLLMPELFGIMAIANVLLIGIEMLSDLGVRQNIVQSSRGDDPEFLNTAWTIQIVRGLLLGMIVLTLSGLIQLAGQYNWLPVGSVYADNRLPGIIAMLSLTPLIAGFESTKLATASRNLAVGHMTIIEVVAQFMGPAVIIAWCEYEPSIWALVAGWFAVSLTRMSLSHAVLPGVNNRLAWDRDSAKDIYHFGKWIFVSSILGFLLNNADRLMFGVFLTSNELGIYAIAFMMVSAMETLLRKLMSSISFPALSELYRREPGSLGGYYYRFRMPIDLVSLFLVGAMFACGQSVIDLLYDDRYRDAGWMLEILAVSLFFIRYDVAGLCYLVLGKPKLLTVIIFIRVVSVYLLVSLACQFYGIKWAIWVVATNYAIALPVMFYFNKVHGLSSLYNEIKVLPMVLLGVAFGSALALALGKI